MKINSKELPLLSLRLQLQLEPYGIKLDTNKFKAMILELEDNGEQNSCPYFFYFAAEIYLTDPLLILSITDQLL